MGASAVARAEGPGFKLGDALVLHPGLGVIAGWDSNVLYSPSNQPDIQAAYIALRPVVDLATLSLQRGGNEPHFIDFRLHLGANFRFLISDQGAAFNQQHISADVDSSAAITFNPFGNITFDLFDNYVRSSVPPYFAVNQPGNLNQDWNTLGARLRWRPGGRRLEASLLYQFGVFAFEPDAVSSQFANKNYLSNDFKLNVSWKFFPKTALYIEVDETIYTYYNHQFATPPDSYPFRAVLGLRGLITPTLTVNLNGGYGYGFVQYTAANGCAAAPQLCPQPSTAMVTVEGSWKPLLTTAVGIGYHHDFNVSLIGSYYDLDTIWLAFTQQVWRVVGSLRGQWEERRFQGNLLLDGQNIGRQDDLLTFHLDLSLPIRDWLSVTLGDDVQINISNCQPNVPSPLACDYKRNDLWLKILAQY